MNSSPAGLTIAMHTSPIRDCDTVHIIIKPFKDVLFLVGFRNTATNYNTFYTVREKPVTRGSLGSIQDVPSFSWKYNFSQTISSIVVYSDIGPL